MAQQQQQLAFDAPPAAEYPQAPAYTAPAQSQFMATFAQMPPTGPLCGPLRWYAYLMAGASALLLVMVAYGAVMMYQNGTLSGRGAAGVALLMLTYVATYKVAAFSWRCSDKLFTGVKM